MVQPLVTCRERTAPRTNFYTKMVVPLTQVFDFDASKSRSNSVKHGIDFVRAQAIWADEDHVEVEARTKDERRWMVVGRISGRLWTAVITRRGDTIRIISVRRARRSERSVYEG